MTLLPKPASTLHDTKYLDILLTPVRACATYQPKMGMGRTEGTSLEQFIETYGADPFYQWMGLDNPLMYAAHKAAGGMTSIYRQVGIGAERLFRSIIIDHLGIEPSKASWSYDVFIEDETGKVKNKSLHLDGRIIFEDVVDKTKRDAILEWVNINAKQLAVSEKIASGLEGVVFEVRQGYKSKDSKRQNADISNAVVAYTSSYLPCVALMSMQIDTDIVLRYRNNKWAFLLGYPEGGATTESLYVFMNEIVGYNLVEFFRRNSTSIRNETAKILESLLRPQ